MAQKASASRLVFWGAVVVVVVALVAVTVGLLLPRADAPQGQPAPTAGAPGSGSENGTGCDRTSSSRAVPGDLRWTASKGVTWPVSDTVGPTRVVDGFPVCFEHSPIGAALAATSIAFAMTDHSAESTARFWVVDSPGKSAYVESMRAAEASQGNLIVNGFAAQGGTVAGFRIDDYTGDTASVRVVVQVPGSARGYLGGQYTLVWIDGDWRQRVNDLGKTEPAVSMFRDEFTPWRADG